MGTIADANGILWNEVVNLNPNYFIVLYKEHHSFQAFTLIFVPIWSIWIYRVKSLDNQGDHFIY